MHKITNECTLTCAKAPFQAFLPADISNRIRNFVKAYCQEFRLKFYDLLEQVGLMRNLVVRTTTTGEVLVLVIFFQVLEMDMDCLLAPDMIFTP